MIRFIAIAFHLLELAFYYLLFERSGGGNLLDLLVWILCWGLLLRAGFVLLTMLIAQVPLRPFRMTFSAFAAEYVATIRLYSFNMIMSAPRIQAPERPDSKHLPVLFIHGFLCNAGFWRSYLKQYRHSWGGHLGTISLQPIYASIDSYSTAIDQRVDELLAASGQEQCLIVAHSMGGLATRAYLRNLKTHSKVAGVITLGTPHQGTLLAHLSFFKNAMQMRRMTKWLETLRSTESSATQPHFESLVATHDNIVAPQECAVYDLADNTYMAGLTHLAMAMDMRLVRWTEERLLRMSR